ncbi:MAG: TIGR04013 family B12-binding domain/radical SAM domain-containing protein [Candidatus Helarchaeota archaeon]
MRKNLLFFKYDKATKYSLAALLGCIEEHSILSDFDIKIGNLEEILQIRPEKFEKVIIAYSFLSTQVKKIQIEIKRIRDIFDDRVIIIGGGPHATAKPESTIQFGFDFLVIGEGEEIFPIILEKIIKNDKFDDLDGICFYKNSEIICKKQLKFVDLDKYPAFSVKFRVFSPIEISRGCGAGRCAYCLVPKMYGNKMRHRSIESIIRLIRNAVKKGFDKVWFNSPNSFAYKSEDGITPNVHEIEKLLKNIKNINGIKKIFYGTFPGEVRPDSVNEDVLNTIIPYISNNSCIVGGQSGSDRILKILRRGHTVVDIENAVDIFLKYEITPKVDMIFGFYFERPEDEELTIQFMRRIIKKGAIIHAHTFMPLPGTPLEKAPPGKLTETYKRFLGEWSKKGKIYGSWGYQEKLASELTELINRN